MDRGGDEAVSELSRAMALIRPQAPSWSFAPVPVAAASRGMTAVGGRREGDVLMLDVAITLVKRRTPGEEGRGDAR